MSWFLGDFSAVLFSLLLNGSIILPETVTGVACYFSALAPSGAIAGTVSQSEASCWLDGDEWIFPTGEVEIHKNGENGRYVLEGEAPYFLTRLMRRGANSNDIESAIAHIEVPWGPGESLDIYRLRLEAGVGRLKDVLLCTTAGTPGTLSGQKDSCALGGQY